jgi:hypothetical protein
MLVTSLSLLGLDGSNQFSSLDGVVFERDEADGVLFPRFDQDTIIMRLLESFDGITIGTQDILLEDAYVSESTLESHGFIDSVLAASLHRKAKNLGPAIPFIFNAHNGLKVRGVVRRFDIIFRYSEQLPAELRSRIRRFLGQCGIGKIEERESND